MKREELLIEAENRIYAWNSGRLERENADSLCAIACILLAQEKRTSVPNPDVERRRFIAECVPKLLIAWTDDPAMALTKARELADEVFGKDGEKHDA